MAVNGGERRPAASGNLRFQIQARIFKLLSLPGHRYRLGVALAPRLRLRMSGLQAIISHGSGSSQAGVHDGGPAFQAMVVVTVKEVGDANRGQGCGRFDGGEGCVVVNNVVGEQRFIAATAAKVESGEIIEGAGSADSRKQQIVFATPERMFEGRPFGLAIGVPGIGLLLRCIARYFEDGRKRVWFVQAGCATRCVTGGRVEHQT